MLNKRDSVIRRTVTQRCQKPQSIEMGNKVCTHEGRQSEPETREKAYLTLHEAARENGICSICLTTAALHLSAQGALFAEISLPEFMSFAENVYRDIRPQIARQKFREQS